MRIGLASFALVMVGLCVLGLAADGTLTPGAEPAPAEVSEGVRNTLKAESLSVSVGGVPAVTFWFRSELQKAATTSTELGVNLGELTPGSLVGVARIQTAWKDYKENTVPPGVYTLRYSVMPADGNHMGASPYRDYLLLVPAGWDTDPGKVLSYDDLVAASAGATGVPHPGVVAIFPLWEEVSVPRLVDNEMGQLSLALKLGETLCALVIEGHGEI